MDVIVDDHLLVQLLLGEGLGEAASPDERIWTTGLWYHRLSRAVASSTVIGSFTRRLHTAGPVLAARVVAALTALPQDIALVSMRDLAWPMAAILGEGARLNLLSLEALAAAEHIGARILLGALDDNPPLIQAAVARGITVQVV